jgi:hypothetical protein
MQNISTVRLVVVSTTILTFRLHVVGFFLQTQKEMSYDGSQGQGWRVSVDGGQTCFSIGFNEAVKHTHTHSHTRQRSTREISVSLFQRTHYE